MNPLIPPTEVAAVRRESLNVTPLASQIQALQVIDNEDLIIADRLLNQIALIRKSIATRIETILKPLNEARNSILELRRELDSIPKQAEDMIREKMEKFRAKEREAIREEESRIRQGQQELQRQADEAARKEAAAKSQKMKDRLAEQRLQLEASAAQLVMERPEPLKVAGSTVRVTKKVVVTDKRAFIKAVAEGSIPLALVDVNTTALNKTYHMAAPVVASWPGISIEDDVTIARR